jgi:Ala-tRNA(Pro) deacylase
MSMPSRLSNYLLRRGIRYEVMSHTHSHSSAETARIAHVPPHQLAKSVVLEDDDGGCVMAVVPADARVNVGLLGRMLGRDSLRLSDEERLCELFPDCDRGAVPAVGMAWGMDTIVDDALEQNVELFIEAGDHDMLIRISQQQFRELMRDVQHAGICRSTAH